MIERYALMFAEAFGNMSDAKGLCGFAGLRDELAGKQLPEAGLRVAVANAAYKLRQACVYADMQDTLPSIERLEQSLFPKHGAPPMPIAGIAQAVMHLLARMRDDLKSEFFFHVDQRDVPLYLTAEPFGQNVGAKFPLAIEDIAEGAKCLALQRPTASVFHLMRVMELGVRSLGKKFKIVIADPRNETWANIIRLVNQKIEALPTATKAQQARKRELASASAHLNAVRIATRNEVMHPKQTYSREEAQVVYNATRIFMTHLADLV